MRLFFLVIFSLLYLSAARADMSGLPANPWSSGKAQTEQINSAANQAFEQTETAAAVISTQSPQGLPANPWQGNQIAHKQIKTTVNETSADASTAAPVELTINMPELQNSAAAIKEKFAANNNSLQNSAAQNQNVGTFEALNALNTLSKYMNNNEDTARYNNNYAEFSSLKNQLQSVFDKQAKAASANTTNTPQFKEIAKVKRKYNSYKSQLKSNYNTLKKQTEPITKLMRQSLSEAEKLSGTRF